MSYPNITDRNLSKGFEEIYIYANDVTTGWLSNLIIIGIYVIAVVSYYNYKRDFVEALAVSGFVTFAISLLFFLAGFLSGVTFVIVIVVTIISTALLFFNNKEQ